MTLLILTNKNEVQLSCFPTGAYRLATVNNALGNILWILEEELSLSQPADIGAFTVEEVLNDITGQGKSVNIWGLDIQPIHLQIIYDFLSKGDKIKFSLTDIEKLRLTYHITKSYFPIGIDIEEGIKFENIETIQEVFYGLLYYYAFNNLKLVKCEHCGRWFATTTLKQKYCTRNSLYEGYTHLTCYNAVENILKQCRRVRTRISDKIRKSCNDTSFYNSNLSRFEFDCDEYTRAISNRASIENLKQYYDFLIETEKSRYWTLKGSEENDSI